MAPTSQGVKTAVLNPFLLKMIILHHFLRFRAFFLCNWLLYQSNVADAAPTFACTVTHLWEKWPKRKIFERHPHVTDGTVMKHYVSPTYGWHCSQCVKLHVLKYLCADLLLGNVCVEDSQLINLVNLDAYPLSRTDDMVIYAYKLMLGLRIFCQTGPPRWVDSLAPQPVYQMKMEEFR